MGKQIVLEFEIAQKEILNSNSMPSHFIVKGNMVSHLREMAAQVGSLYHPEEVQLLVQEKLQWLKSTSALQMKKTRLKKKLLKDGGFTAEEIAKEIAERFPEDEKPIFDIEPLFSRFTLQLVVMPPTRRRVDPPNLWPSLKALGDGLTDSGFWVDDSFEYLLETSFRYGGLSGLKGKWRLQLVITEVDDLSSFQLTAESSDG